MTKLHLLCFIALAIGCTNAFARLCPLYSDESRKEFYFDSGYLWGRCYYQNGRLRAKVEFRGGLRFSDDYYSNGIPKESSMENDTKTWFINKKYNPSGMLIYHMERVNRKLRFECFHAGGYRLKCHDFINDVDYDESVEYVSEYEFND